MRILVTGADGFVGRHAVAELLAHGHEVLATSLKPGTVHGLQVLKLDVTNVEQTRACIKENAPDAVMHLAGLAHTKDTENNLPLLFEVNVASVSNICDSLRRVSGSRPKSVLIVSSAFVYGGSHKQGQLSCDELTPVDPRGAYGFSKVAAEASGQMYDGHGLKVYVARPFNHIGPGQHPSFVVSGFAQKMAFAGHGDAIITGSLDSKRDFTDVRDVARGYRLILEKRPAESVFVFGSGKAVQIKEVFETLNTISGKNLTNKIDPSLLRSNDDSAIIGESSQAYKTLGWKPEIPLGQSLLDAYQEFSK